MDNKKTNIIALFLIILMFGLSFFSMKKDALTFDELAHIPAGYSYLKYQDYRINPEHPPLIKSISSFPLVFRDLNFPEESQNWKQEDAAPAWWVQFDLGNEFIYHSENDPREIIFWSRLPMILMLLFFGLFLFRWAREIGGNKTAIASLFLFSLSPTLIAHGRLVTTDVGAGLGVLIGTYYWIKFIKNPDFKNVIKASLGLGIALLFKFSLALLIPFFGIITIIYSLLNFSENRIKYLAKYIGLSFVIGVFALVFVIWPVYAYHNWNHPIENQIRDTRTDLRDNPIPPARDLVYQMTETEHLRHLGQYFRGLLMATQRTGWGNNVYFLGEISSKGWWYYFPVIYLIKEPLSLHILTLLALFSIMFLSIKKRSEIKNGLKLLKTAILNNFTIFSFLIFIGIYWAAAIVGNLNIGVRHLIPIFPFVYIILSDFMIRRFLPNTKRKKESIILISILFIWYGLSSILSYPNYIPYYNESVGGSKDAYVYAVDSNYDWGQDFYLLLDFIEENEIEEIYIDYFGGESLDYWLEGKYKRFNPKEVSSDLSEGIPLDEAGGGIKGWLAVSVNQFMGGIAKPVPDFNQETGFYNWLKEYEPVDRAGKSIFIYYID